MLPSTMRDERHANSPWATRFLVAVTAILIVSAFFRFYGLNWDDGHYFHPDERFIATVMDNRLSLPALDDLQVLFNPDESPLNTRSDGEEGTPRDFAYGSLPVLIATVLGTFFSAPLGIDLTSYQHIDLFGRFLTGLVDLGTVVLVILFARRAFGDLAAVIAGALTAGSVILIQLAHFFTVDAWVTFLTIATLYAALQIIRRFSPEWTLAVGALGGAALATKVSVGVLAIPIIVALVLGASSVTDDWRSTARVVIRRLLLSAVPAVIVFALFEPYAIWQPAVYLDDILHQWEIVNGHLDVPYTRQFVGTTAGITEVRDLVLWGIAPGFGVAALIATLLGCYFVFAKRDPRYILLLSWIVPYFFVIASSEARFLRYSAPLVPVLAIMVGHQLSLWWHNSSANIRDRLWPAAAIIAVLAVTFGWAAAFMTVYTGEHPRVEASEWIYENVEPGATLTSEVWDDTLPVRLESHPTPAYERIRMDLYADRPPDEALAYIAGTLREADYIILASQRLSHSIPRLPWRYPVESQYYRLLHDEQLGYELAYKATNFPGFGSYRINTLNADESFSVYDHTPVWIFRKVEELSDRELQLRFANALDQTWIPAREPANPTLMLNQPVDEIPAAGDVGWSSAVTDSDLLATIIWLLMLTLMGAIALPVVLRLFPMFAELGIGFASLLGLLGVGVITWLFWSLNVSGFTVWTILISAGILTLLTWHLIGLPDQWRELWAASRVRVLVGLAVFLAVFVAFTVIRAANPDLWHPVFGGERPMETAYINAIARSETFPPYDPWFSGGHLNYYYYGFFLFTVLAKVTGIPIDAAFHLMLATIAASIAAGAYSLGGTLTGSLVQTRKPEWLIGGGLLAAFFAAVAGNLDAVRQMIQSRGLEVSFWDSSRVVEFGITEFPFFSVLYGDLHPHLIAAPILLLVVGLVISWVQLSGAGSPGWLALWIVATTVVFGSITVTNLWDGPTAGIILVAGLLLPTLRRTRTPWTRLARAASLIPVLGVGSWLLFYPFHSRYVAQTDGLQLTNFGTSASEWLIHFGGLAIVLVVALIAAFRRLTNTNPFSFSFLFYGAALGIAGYIAGSVIGWGLHEPASNFLVPGGLVVVAGAVIAQAPAGIRTKRDRAIALVLSTPFIFLAGVLAWERPVGAIGSLLVAAFLVLFMTNQQRDGVLVGSICGAAGAGLILTTEILFIADHLQGSDWERMNTVFKLYFQAWNLFAIVAAGTGMWLINQGRQRFRGITSPGKGVISLSLVGAWVGAVAGPVLILAMLAYPVFATPDRVRQDMNGSPSGLTLDGYEWMSGGMIQNQAGDVISFTGDRKAIGWLKENVESNQVILEAAIGPYVGGGSRISAATGLPTVMGWGNHQSQQRGRLEVRQRAIDVRETYSTESIERKWELLRRYNVDYVIVGDVERHTIMSEVEAGEPIDYYSSGAGLAAFEELVGDGLEVAFESEGTVIYRVGEFAEAGQVT